MGTINLQTKWSIQFLRIGFYHVRLVSVFCFLNQVQSIPHGLSHVIHFKTRQMDLKTPTRSSTYPPFILSFT